jgi:hypothetical protein
VWSRNRLRAVRFGGVFLFTFFLGLATADICQVDCIGKYVFVPYNSPGKSKTGKRCTSTNLFAAHDGQGAGEA